MLKPRRIIIHHSATEDSRTLSWGAIRRYHTEVNGWADIGYHAGVECIRDGYEAIIGRPWVEPGAHTKGENRDSLGFCFVGNYDAQEPHESMMRVAARSVLVPWLAIYELDLDRIFGHRDFAAKTCPGRLFDLGKLRDIVADEARSMMPEPPA